VEFKKNADLIGIATAAPNHAHATFEAGGGFASFLKEVEKSVRKNYQKWG